MFFEIRGRLYRVDRSQGGEAEVPSHVSGPVDRFSVCDCSDDGLVGTIDESRGDARVVPERAPLDESTRILREIAQQILLRAALWNAATGRPPSPDQAP